MSTANFDPAKCCFPEKGKPDDLFNTGFKLYVEVEIEKAETLFFIIKWKGVYILLHGAPLSCEGYPCSGHIEITWSEPPSIAEFLEMVGEPIPEKQTEYSYAWVLGYKISETEFELMDTLNAHLTVEVEPKLPVGLLIGCGIATVGLYGAGTAFQSTEGKLSKFATPLKLAMLIPVGVCAWKGGGWAYEYVKGKI